MYIDKGLNKEHGVIPYAYFKFEDDAATQE